MSAWWTLVKKELRFGKGWIGFHLILIPITLFLMLTQDLYVIDEFAIFFIIFYPILFGVFVCHTVLKEWSRKTITHWLSLPFHGFYLLSTKLFFNLMVSGFLLISLFWVVLLTISFAIEKSANWLADFEITAPQLIDFLNQYLWFVFYDHFQFSLFFGLFFLLIVLLYKTEMKWLAIVPILLFFVLLFLPGFGFLDPLLFSMGAYDVLIDLPLEEYGKFGLALSSWGYYGEIYVIDFVFPIFINLFLYVLNSIILDRWVRV